MQMSVLQGCVRVRQYILDICLMHFCLCPPLLTSWLMSNLHFPWNIYHSVSRHCTTHGEVSVPSLRLQDMM